MTAEDQRTSRRDRILLLARLRIEGEVEVYDVRIRDLSAGGLRAQYVGSPLDKARVAIEIRNLGWVEGIIAWHKAGFIGVRFNRSIDPEKARIAVTGEYAPPRPSSQAVLRRL